MDAQQRNRENAGRKESLRYMDGGLGGISRERVASDQSFMVGQIVSLLPKWIPWSMCFQINIGACLP